VRAQSCLFRPTGEGRQVWIKTARRFLALASVCVFCGAVTEAEAGTVGVNSPSRTESHFVKVVHEIVETKEAVDPHILISCQNIIGSIIAPPRNVRIVRFSPFFVSLNDRAGWIFFCTPISRIGPTIPEFFRMNDVDGLVNQESWGLAIIAVCDLNFGWFQPITKRQVFIAEQFNVGNEDGRDGKSEGCFSLKLYRVSGTLSCLNRSLHVTPMLYSNVDRISGQLSLASSSDSQNDGKESQDGRGEGVYVIPVGVKPAIHDISKHSDAVGGTITLILLGMGIAAVIIVSAPLGTYRAEDYEDQDDDRNGDK
jgi:hypothetical protein